MSTPTAPDPSNYDAAREEFATSGRLETEPVEVARTTKTTTTPDLVTPASGARPYRHIAADLGVDRASCSPVVPRRRLCKCQTPSMTTAPTQRAFAAAPSPYGRRSQMTAWVGGTKGQLR
jgi:hypothetical protein